MRTEFLILLITLSIIFGFIKIKYGNYINGKLVQKNDSKKAIKLFENSIKNYNLIDKSHFQLAVCYENIAIKKDQNKQFNLSKSFVNYFNAIYYSKENNNYKTLEKVKNNIQQLYYSFNQEEKEKNLNLIFSAYNSIGKSYYLPRYLSILNNELGNMYKDFEQINNIHFKLFKENTIEV